MPWLLGLSACGGASPLMHPAQPLRQGHVRFAGGTASTFALGEAADAITLARSVQPGSVVDKLPEAYVRGALAVAAMAPGMSPFAAGRVGLGYDAEAGLGYTGRTVRLDARWAAQGENVAGSVGVGGSALLSHRGTATGEQQVGGLALDGVSGFGADVPVLVGWRSRADAVWWWGGARGGYEKLRGSVGFVRPQPDTVLEGDVDGRRLYAYGVTGLAMGFRHLHAAVEVQAGYQHAQGTLWNVQTDVRGMSVSPAAALIGSF